MTGVKKVAFLGLWLLCGAPGFVLGQQPKDEKKEAAKAETATAPASPAQSPSGISSLAPGVVARLNGREITVQDYTAYLFASLGKSKVREFIDRLLLEEEGKRLEVNVSPEEVEDRVNNQVNSSLKALYQGNMEKFLDSLSKRGMTLDEHKQKLRQDTAYKLLEEKCILKTRSVTEDDVKARFEQTYGAGGVQFEIRHILFSTRRKATSGGPADTKSPAAVEQEAREKAEKVLKELQGGADFIQMVRTYSEDDLTRNNDGRIPQYRKGYRGQEFHEAVIRLTEESRVSGVVRSPQGFHIVQLIDRKVTRIEDKREELLTVLKQQQPTAGERNALLKGLRDKAKIEL